MKKLIANISSLLETLVAPFMPQPRAERVLVPVRVKSRR